MHSEKNSINSADRLSRANDEPIPRTMLTNWKDSAVFHLFLFFLSLAATAARGRWWWCSAIIRRRKSAGAISSVPPRTLTLRAIKCFLILTTTFKYRIKFEWNGLTLRSGGLRGGVPLLADIRDGNEASNWSGQFSLLRPQCETMGTGSPNCSRPPHFPQQMKTCDRLFFFWRQLVQCLNGRYRTMIRFWFCSFQVATRCGHVSAMMWTTRNIFKLI